MPQTNHSPEHTLRQVNLSPYCTSIILSSLALKLLHTFFSNISIFCIICNRAFCFVIVDCPEMCPLLLAVVRSLLLMQIFSMWASLTTMLSAPGLSLGREGLRMAWGFWQ